MSTAEWNEVKRLAADFQKAQLSSSEQKLSESNCIEIINKLIETKLLNVIYTLDGKEYVTPQQLTREIRDELYVHGGRINLVELASILNVDLSQVTERAAEIKKSDPSCTIVLGQLINSTYLRQIAIEINERLSEHGQITVGELAQHYDLFGDFLQSVIEKQLGKIIRGKQDKTNPRIFYTDAFVSRNRACIRGALAGITKPITVSALLTLCGVQEGVFYSLIDKMTEANEVPGVVTGKRGGNVIYVPTVYSKSQSDWVDNFYKQNGYLEYDAMTRLGISDPQTFIKKHFPNEKLLALPSCAVGSQLFEMVEAAVEEAVSTGTFVDVMPMLPSVFEPQDANMIIKEIIKNDKTKSLNQQIQIFCLSIVVTEQYIQYLKKQLDELIKERAENVVSTGVYQKFHADNKLQQSRSNFDEEIGGKVDKREERRKKASGGKVGGGTQGRETKMKSTRKKYNPGKGGGGDSDSDTPQSSMKTSKASGQKLDLLTLSDVREVIEGEDLLMEDDLVDLVSELAEHLLPSSNKTALLAAEAAFETSMASGAQNRRKVHSELQDKLNSMIVNVKQFEKGIKNFTQKETQLQLYKYLLKSLCTDIANEIFAYVAQENMIQYDQSKELSIESRLKILNEVPPKSKEILMMMHKSLASDSIDAFLSSCEPALGSGVCDMVLRKPDKKKERPLLFNHRAALLEQLNASEDPSAVLLLASLIIFQAVTQTMLHASGRFVSHILTFIKPSLSLEDYVNLQQFYDLVMQLLTADGDKDVEEEITKSLNDSMPKIKEIATLYKKPTAAEKSQNADD